jgi:hypothetical protein
MNFFIITTILSLTLSILIYFGILRYIKLHFVSHEKYLENYKNIPKAKNKKIVISMTTTPEKIKKLKPVINSILDQTIKVDQIVLNIPKNKEYDIPQEYKDIVSIYKCGQDYGCCSKFIPTILREDNNDTVIILLEDDVIYGDDFLETLVEEYNNNNYAIISNKAILVIPEFFNTDIINNRKNEVLDDDWIIKNIKSDKKYMSYFENYRMLY